MRYSYLFKAFEMQPLGGKNIYPMFWNIILRVLLSWLRCFLYW